MDILKGLTILLVIIGHVTRTYTNAGTNPQLAESRFVEIISEWIYSFHMPLFMGMSGYIYHILKSERGKYKEIWTFAKKKFLRLIVPYLFAYPLFVFLPLYLINSQPQADYSASDFFYNYLFVLDVRHLWFIVSLFSIFIIYNFFWNSISINPFSYLCLFLSISVLTNYIKLPDILQITMTCRFILWFHVGCILSIVLSEISMFKNGWIFWGGLILNIIFFSLSQKFYSCDYIQIPSALISSMCGILMMLSLSFSVQKLNMFIWGLSYSKDSYGIYLTHMSVVWSIAHFTQNLPIPPLIVVPVSTLVTLLTSLIVCRLLRLMHLKFIIGEI